MWNRIVGGLPSGQLSFLLRAGSDTLPTPLNLARWTIQSSSRCALCNSNHPTVAHILNGCPVALNQGRYTWRHDSVLSLMVSSVSTCLESDQRLFADLPGHQASNSPPSTIPVDILSTSCRPDIVLCHGKNIKLLELTVCSNTLQGLQSACTRKQSKQVYVSLLNDLESIGYTVSYDTV